MNQSWSFIIFGYNESDTLLTVLNSVVKFSKENNITDREIIIVDDGSTDETRNLSEDFKLKNEGVNYIRHDVNLGIGPTLLNGYYAALKENAVAIPADGQFDITELKNNVNFPDNSYLSFYRELKKNYSSFRNFISSLNGFINREFLYLNIRDVNWVKAYKSSDLKSIGLKIRSSLVCSEICAKLNLKGYSAKEIQSVYHERTAGNSKGASFKTLKSAVRDIIRLITEIRKFKKALSGN